MTARDKFRQSVTETLTSWRLGIRPFRPDGSEVAIFKEGFAEIVDLRLQLVYLPMLQGLMRLDHLLELAFDPRQDPYAPPIRRAPVKFEALPAISIPEFLQDVPRPSPGPTNAGWLRSTGIRRRFGP